MSARDVRVKKISLIFYQNFSQFAIIKITKLTIFFHLALARIDNMGK